MSVNVNRLNILLEESFKKEILKHLKGNLLGLYVVDDSGFIVHSIISKNTKKKVEENVVGAISSLLKTTFLRFTREFSKKSQGIFTFDTELYKFIFCLAGDEFMFVVVSDPEITLDPIFENASATGEKIALIIAGVDTIPFIPSVFEREFIKKEKYLPTRIDNFFAQFQIFLNDIKFIYKNEKAITLVESKDLSSSRKLGYMKKILGMIKKRLLKFHLIS